MTTLSDECSINLEADRGSPTTCNSADGNAPDVNLKASKRTSNPFLRDGVPTNTNFVGPVRLARLSGRNRSTSTPSELTTTRQADMPAARYDCRAISEQHTIRSASSSSMRFLRRNLVSARLNLCVSENKMPSCSE